MNKTEQQQQKRKRETDKTKIGIAVAALEWYDSVSQQIRHSIKIPLTGDMLTHYGIIKLVNGKILVLLWKYILKCGCDCAMDFCLGEPKTKKAN